ncbi:MAG TPA: Coenzyme F420 hydrogenase/dehydrogenase, beta subunit C-terminal domain [Dongiaceae bacterium]|nr:Coenzyme F420 hydrogenase/dehydrogenase, beta subunit C-terminal domain [Dongiaceae bacterium]
MTRVRDLQTVVTRGLCTGCGLCESMLGRDTVEMKISSDGYLRPQIKAPIDPARLGRVLDVCPGAIIRGPSAAVLEGAGTLDPVWGPIISLDRAWAGDPAIRFRAAAGGMLTALGCYLLESGAVEAILHVKASASQPILTDAHISRSRAEVIAGSQSRYGPAAPLVHVEQLLDEGVSFAVIAKPCDIAAIRNLMRIDPRARQQIKYCLSLFCGGVPSTKMAEKISRYVGFEPEELSVLRWRGEGWPGPTHLETKDGRRADITYDQAWYDPSVPWTYDMQFRCKICPDAIGELADISCPDGWVMENGKPLHREAPGMNIAIARTPAGAALLQAAIAAGAVETAPFTRDELHQMHSDHLDRKLGFPGRNAGMRLAGEPGLRAPGFRPWAMLREGGFAAAWKAFWGGFRRARARANRENPR